MRSVAVLPASPPLIFAKVTLLSAAAATQRELEDATRSAREQSEAFAEQARPSLLGEGGGRGGGGLVCAGRGVTRGFVRRRPGRRTSPRCS